MSPHEERAHLLRDVWGISWPTVIYSLLETLVGIVDIYLASYLGDEAVASIGLSRQVFLIMLIGTMAITTGTIALTSQYYGAKRYDLASAVVYHSVLLSIISGGIFGVLGVILAKPSMHLMGATGFVLQYGTEYLSVLMAGVVFLLMNFSTNAIFRALGDPKTPLKISLFVNVLNVGFSYLFVFGVWIFPVLGVMGIALGTILARVCGSIIALYLLCDRRRTVYLDLQTRFHFDLLKKILNIGLPSGISGFFRNGARILFFRIIAATVAGTSALAAASIGFQVRMFVILPALAIQVGVAALVGQSLGKNDMAKAEAYGWTGIKFCSIVMGLMSAFFFFFPHWIITLFTESPEVMRLGILALRFIALEQFCNCVSIVSSGALAGAGDTKPSLRYTIISQWFFMLPLAYSLAFLMGYDNVGAWIAWGIAPVIQMVLILIRFARGRWKTIYAKGAKWPEL